MTATPCPLVTALLAAIDEIPEIERSKEGQIGKQRFRYAPLEKIEPVVRPILTRHQVLVTHEGRWKEGQFFMLTIARHPETEREVVSEIPVIWKDGPGTEMQRCGNAQSYAERQGLEKLLRIVTTEDIDGAGAGGDPGQPSRQRAAQERNEARREVNASPGTPDPGPESPGGGLEQALRSAQGSGFDTAGFMLAQAQEHGLMADNGKPRRDLFEVVTADQAAAMLEALGKARTEAMREGE